MLSPCGKMDVKTVRRFNYGASMGGAARTDRTGLRGLTRRLAWGGSATAVLALLLNLLVWALYAPAMGLGIRTPICTPEGARTILVDARTGQKLDEDGPAHADIGGRHCPLGLLATSLAAPPALLLTAPVLPRLADRSPIPAQPVPPAPVPTGWQARAPPLA